MASFAGWVLVGNLGFTFKDQLSNILLNVFLGTTVNAARGVSMQVNGIVNTFSRNFFMAISPQITKQYAANDIEKSKQLVYISTKFSFLLMGVLTIPIFVNAKYLLSVWLLEVPQYTYEFICIVIIVAQLTSLSYAVTTAIQATGNIKSFQIGISMIMLMELPIAYVLLKNGMPAPYALLPAIFTSFVGVFYRFAILKKQVVLYKYKEFVFGIVLRPIIVYSVTLGICYAISLHLLLNMMSFVYSSFLYIVVYLLVILSIGLNKTERSFLAEKMVNFRMRNKDA